MSINNPLNPLKKASGVINWENINGRPDLSSVSSIKVQPTILSASLWIDEHQEIPIQGVSVDETQQLILLKPKYSSQQLFDAAGIKIVGQSENIITVKADTVPTEDVSVIFYILGVAEVKEEYTGTFEWWSPKMTANDSPSPYIASATSVWSSSGAYEPYFAFDGVSATISGGFWASKNSPNVDTYCQIDLGRQMVINGIKANPVYAPGHVIATPKDIYLAGSNDGVNFVELYKNNDASWGNENSYTEFLLESPVKYRYYRIGSSGTDTNVYDRRTSYGDIQFHALNMMEAT